VFSVLEPSNTMRQTSAFSTMATKDLEPGTKVVVLSPEGIGIDKPATAMATILELTDSHTGEGTTYSRTTSQNQNPTASSGTV
jgi:hypothetical protein